MTVPAPTVVVPPLPPPLNEGRRQVFDAALATDDVQLVEIDDLIARADAHVDLAEDGTASISERIGEALSPLEVEHVKLLVSLHNARPAGLRATPVGRNIALKMRSEPQALGDACVASASARTYWWGFRIYMDHCLCNDIAFAVGAGTGATGVIFGLLSATEVVTAVGAGWVGLAVGIIVTLAAWIAWADGHCNGAGCNYNQSWTVQGWITTVC